MLHLEYKLPTFETTGNFEGMGDNVGPNLGLYTLAARYDDDFENFNVPLALTYEVQTKSN